MATSKLADPVPPCSALFMVDTGAHAAASAINKSVYSATTEQAPATVYFISVACFVVGAGMVVQMPAWEGLADSAEKKTAARGGEAVLGSESAARVE